MKNVLKRIMQAAPLIMILIMAAVYVLYLRDLSIEQLLEYTPSEPVAAAAVILLMYALKSMSYFFPMFLIAAAAGIILPLYAAIPINLIGIIIMASVPYWVGRFAEQETVDKLANKYPKVHDVREFGSNHQLFGAFFLRIVSCLPYDIVSLTMGSFGFSFRKYIVGSFLGTAPGIILTTIMGSAITEPFSPEFIICVFIEIIIAVSSAVAYRKYNKSKTV